MKRRVWLVLALCLMILISCIVADARTKSKQTNPGIVRGTVVYTYNNMIGSQPDVGTKVFLVVGKLVIARDHFGCDSSDGRFMVVTNAKQTLFTDDTVEPKYVYYKLAGKTTVDGNGNFSITNVKPGTYTVILNSAHTHNTKNGELCARNVICRIEQKIVTVRSAQSVDVSCDFGMDARLSVSDSLLAVKALDKIIGDKR